MQYVSKNGVLNVNITVEATDFVVDWLQLPRRSYDSQIPGPTWRIKAGDQINLRLVRITRPGGMMITMMQNAENMDQKLLYHWQVPQ